MSEGRGVGGGEKKLCMLRAGVAWHLSKREPAFHLGLILVLNNERKPLVGLMSSRMTDPPFLSPFVFFCDVREAA